MSTKRKSHARSWTARGAATRARIVDAATDLIYTHGVERTSLDDVMAVSGVSKSQLYHYFADKEGKYLFKYASNPGVDISYNPPARRIWI